MSGSFFAFWKEKLNYLDVHYHVNPDSFKRRYNVLQAGEVYKRSGGGVVLKNHLGSTTALASLAQEQGIPVFGSVALNAVSGGLSLNVVRQALCQYVFKYSGRLLVHLPTVVRSKHKSRLSRQESNQFVTKFGNITLNISENGVDLRPEVLELLQMASYEPLVISSGHANFDEVHMLIEAADKIGNIKIMLNQPASPITGMTANDLKKLGNNDWLFIEQTALTVLLGYQAQTDFFKVIKDCHNVVFSSDLGQISQMDIEEWRSVSKSWFKQAGLSMEQTKEINLHNPLLMLSE